MTRKRDYLAEDLNALIKGEAVALDVGEDPLAPGERLWLVGIWQGTSHLYGSGTRLYVLDQGSFGVVLLRRWHVFGLCRLSLAEDPEARRRDLANLRDSANIEYRKRALMVETARDVNRARNPRKDPTP